MLVVNKSASVERTIWKLKKNSWHKEIICIVNVNAELKIIFHDAK